MVLTSKRSYPTLQVRNRGKKENRIGAEPVPLVLYGIFNLNFEQKTTTNKNVKFLTSLQRNQQN